MSTTPPPPPRGTTFTVPSISTATTTKPVYARVPGGTSASRTFLDLNSKIGFETFKLRTAPLPERFNGKGQYLQQFILSLSGRCPGSIWEVAKKIPDKNGKTWNLFTQHGKLTLTDIETHAKLYHNKEMVEDQDMYHMYMCMRDSLTATARNSINLKRDRFILDGEPNGLLYFKTIVMEAEVDTRATISLLKRQLFDLTSLFQKCDQNVKTFNDSVAAVIDRLKARDTTYDEDNVILQVFGAYKTCGDITFHAYMSRQYDDYVDGKTDISLDALFTMGQNKYEIAIEEGSWKTITDEQRQVYSALFAGQNNDTADQANQATSDKKKDGKEIKYPKWKFRKPKDVNDTKEHNSRTYFWCPNHKNPYNEKHHGMWVAHKPSDCKAKTPITTKENDNEATKDDDDRLQIDANHAETDDASESDDSRY